MIIEKKNKSLYLLVLLFMLTIVLIALNSKGRPTMSATDDVNYRAIYQNAVVETAYQYYYRGKAIQYDSMTLNYENESNGEKNKKSRSYYVISSSNKTKIYTQGGMHPLGMYSPEDATIQDYMYAVCNHFTNYIYSETFSHKSTGEKYQVTDKDGKVTSTTSGLIKDGDDIKEKSKYSDEIAVLFKRLKQDYNTTEKKNKLKKEIIDNILKPGDIIAASKLGSGGHAVVYIGKVNGEHKIIHSTSVAPKAYKDIGSKINNYGIPRSKYHLESKGDMIESQSGTLEYNTDIEKDIDKNGSIKMGSLETQLDSFLGYDAFVIIRPINEILKNSDIELSRNSKARREMPKISITKIASIEKYDSVNLGDTIKYTITVDNKSDKNYTNIKVEETVPKYTTLKSQNSLCTSKSGKVTCTISSLSKGKSVSIDYTVTVDKNINNLGKIIESKDGKLYTKNNNYISLKQINTKINKTLTKTERTNLATLVKNEKGKSYGGSIEFINSIYKQLGYNISMISTKNVFTKLFTKGKYTVKSDTSEFSSRTLYKAGTELDSFKFKKRSNVEANYQKYYDMYVDGLFGGITTTSELESGNTHNRNTTYTSKSLLPGDVLYVHDSNHLNDHIDKNGGYIVGNETAYLYLGSGNFATVSRGKVYIYNDTKFDYYFYTPNRSSSYKVDVNDKNTCPNCKAVSRGERLLTSLIGQDCYIVLRPSYSFNEKATKIEVSKMPTKVNYIQNKETISLKGGELKVTYGSLGSKTIKLDSSDITATGFNNSKVGSTTVTLKYENVTTTMKLNIVSKSVSSISIKTKPSKLNYVQNSEQVNLSGGVLLVKYNDSSKDEIDMSSKDIKVIGFNNTKVGKQTITLDYLGKTVTLDINIIKSQVASISLDNLPKKVDYLEGKDNLDLKGALLTVKYNDNKTETINLPSDRVSVSGFNNNSVGTNKITLSYGGKTTTFNVTINPKTIVKIEMDKSPGKVTYIKDMEELDLTNGSILASYDNGKSNTIKLTSSNIKVSGFSNSTIGTKTIKVEYLGMKTEFKVKVVDESKRKVKTIEIYKLPAKTTYTKNVEELDLYGGIIRVQYSDNSEEQISMKSSNVTTSGFNNKKTGKNTITISYLGKSTTFEVNIKSREIVSAEIVEKPSQTTITDIEKIEYTEGKIEVKYSDNTKEEVTFESPNVKVYDSGDPVISDEDGMEENKTLIVDYKGIKNSFNVKVYKLMGYLNELEDEDYEIDYSEYGVFYDAVGMKPNEVITTIVAIFGISIVLFFLMKKVK